MTATSISIGVLYFKNYDQSNSDNGGASITGGDLLADAKIVVKDLNAHGGIAGRTVAPVYFGYDKTTTESFSAQDQAACTAMTQDHKVFAVLGSGLTSNFKACIERAGGLVIGTEILKDGAVTYRTFPHFFDVQGLDADRFSTALVATLATQKWFGGWNAATGTAGSAKARVGVLSYDTPSFRNALKDHLLPSLARQGYAVTADNLAYIADPSSTADEGPAAASLQNAILRFRQHGVDHVVVVDTNGGMTQLLMTNAQTQSYFPRYAVGSGSGLEAYLEGGLISAQQLGGVVGVGWLPMLDLSSADNSDDGRYSGSARRACLDLMRKGGQAFTSSNAESIALLYCDEFGFVKKVLFGYAGQGVNRDAFSSSVATLGISFASASLGAASFSSDKHSAVARTYTWLFNAGCGCMRYSGSPRPVT